MLQAQVPVSVSPLLHLFLLVHVIVFPGTVLVVLLVGVFLLGVLSSYHPVPVPD